MSSSAQNTFPNLLEISNLNTSKDLIYGTPVPATSRLKRYNETEVVIDLFFLFAVNPANRGIAVSSSELVQSLWRNCSVKFFVLHQFMLLRQTHGVATS